ncbi:fibropellin-1 [Daktulosphaira vitifoliae]|uniref:fibropellin-1 n=1 Tax=Daktulosphaira vitifoliae TaxID=58002 RepID=UPI0021AA8535|nr:fibropellin-1 [Daktulosphaira vitifoliae]
MTLCLTMLAILAAVISPMTQGMIIYNPTSYTSGRQYYNPCSPNPCGTNTNCRVNNDRPVCSCLPGYFGNPLSICQRGECEVNSDCTNSRVCRNYKCEDVCAGQCGINAQCTARNHVAVCSCLPGYNGDPSSSCRQNDPQEQCHPSPCGANTKCEVINDVPVCSCLPGYVGSGITGCRHECESDYECGPTQMCQNYLCTAACAIGTCASTAICDVQNHRPVCSCPKGYFGNPLVSCRAECLTHSDCPSDRPSCLGEKCVNPCTGVCGINANCEVRDHIKAVCSCPKTMTGDPFVRCRPFEPADLCEPFPCGSNAKCTPGHDVSGQERPVCTCLSGYVGNAIAGCIRGECESDIECRYDQTCSNYKCQNVCAGQCGVDAECNARNRVATCTCPPGYEGDASVRCYPKSSRNARIGRVYYNKK